MKRGRRRGVGPTGAVVSRRNGFALVAALWIMVALAAVGLDAALTSQTRRRAAANVLDEARARASIYAAGEWARSRLTAASLGSEEEIRSEVSLGAEGAWTANFMFDDAGPGPRDDPWWNARTLLPPELTLGDAQLRIAVRDVGTALNPNEASEEMLRQFFASGLEVDFALAGEITQAILDWRDEDDLPRVNGGEIDAYLDAGRAALPANRGFATVDELGYVLGMTPEILERARPFLILVGTGDININSAPYEVLVAVPGMSPEAAEAVLRLRESGRYPRRQNDIEDLVSRSAERRLDRNDRDFRNRSDFLTTELEILIEGGVVGSPIELRMQLVVTRRSDGEPRVIWRAVG